MNKWFWAAAVGAAFIAAGLGYVLALYVQSKPRAYNAVLPDVEMSFAAAVRQVVVNNHDDRLTLAIWWCNGDKYPLRGAFHNNRKGDLDMDEVGAAQTACSDNPLEVLLVDQTCQVRHDCGALPAMVPAGRFDKVMDLLKKRDAVEP